MITRILITFISIVFCLSCSNNLAEKNIEFKTSSGEIAKGTVYPDSVLNGKINYYSLNNEYLGYTTYRYGYEAGPDVRIRNDKFKDSLFYEKPIRNGIEFMFDSTGRLYYQAHLLGNRVVGSFYQYDTLNKLTHFGFYNFEGDLIYEAKYNTTDKFEKGSIINFKINNRNIDGQNKQILFLYIIQIHGFNDFYELAIMDKERKVIKSNKIITSDFFYQTVLDPVLPTQHYAIIYHYTFQSQQSDKVVIQEIF